MAEYIERDKAIEWARLIYCKDCNSYNGIMCRACGFDDTILLIEEYPAADVVEVVRCGQCKHATEDIIVEGVCYCHKIQQGMFIDGFCSYGERRKE